MAGRDLGAFGAARALASVGAALELEPGPGTVAGTVILGAVAVGVAGTYAFDFIEPYVKSEVERGYNYVNSMRQ